MDIGVYSFQATSEEKIGELLDSHQTFVLEDVSRIQMSESIDFLERKMSERGLKCRVYTKGRVAALGAGMLIPGAGWLAALGIAAHNVGTWSPDYEIAKNLATGTLTVTYQKKN